MSLIAIWLTGGGVIPTSILAIIAALCFLHANFRAWRDERRALTKANAPPRIAGIWARHIYAGAIGILNISFDGEKVTGNFREGDIDHRIEGTYDPIKRQFNVITQRVHISDRSVLRFNQAETWWVVGDRMLLFSSPKNANGHPERGILDRQA